MNNNLKMTVLSNIPKYQIAIDFSLCVAWSIFNVAYIRILSRLIEDFSDKNPVIGIIIGYFSFLLVWEIIE